MDLTNAGLLERAWRVMGYDAIWDDYRAIRDAVCAEQREMDARIAEEQPIDVEDTTQSIGMCHRIAAAIRAQEETR